MNKNAIIGIAIGVLVVAIGIIAFTMSRSGDTAPAGQGEQGQLPPQARQMMMQQQQQAGGAKGVGAGAMGRAPGGYQRR
jgi:flagellar basal body-associated protein FliL